MKKFVTIFLISVFLSSCSPLSSQTMRSTVDAAVNPNFPTAILATASVILPTDTSFPHNNLLPSLVPEITVSIQDSSVPISDPQMTGTAVAFEKWTPDQVVAVFQAVGLEVVSPGPISDKDYADAPRLAIIAFHFLTPSLCDSCGGRILSFANEKDQNTLVDFYNNLGSWVFIKDNILVQLNGFLPVDKANLYQSALNNLK